MRSASEIVVTASRRQRAHARRGKAETSGPGRAEVEARRPLADQRQRRRGGGRRPLGDPRLRALAKDEVTLRGQLRVRVDRDPPRDAELARQVARGRHPRAAVQLAAADRAPQLVLDLRAERALPVAGD